MKLIINGKEAYKGMEVETRRGEKYILTGWKEPTYEGKSGRVYCKTKQDYENRKFRTNEWFAGVIGGEFVEEEN